MDKGLSVRFRGACFLAVFLSLMQSARSAEPALAAPVRVNPTLELRLLSKPQSPPATFKFKLQDQVELRVTSDTDGELHIHAYQLVFKVVAHQTNLFRFKARATGKFRFDWHPNLSNNTSAGVYPHSPPAAWLLVYPN